MTGKSKLVNALAGGGIIGLVLVLAVTLSLWSTGESASAQETVAATVLLEDNFDGENGGVGLLNYTGFANWNVLGGTVDLLGNGFFDLLPVTGLYVDLDGSTGVAGKLESKTTFSLEPGDYQLEFALAGSQRGDTNTVTVALGTVYSESFTLESDAPLTSHIRTISVTSSTSGTLSFDHSVGDFLGILLDDVKLTLLPGDLTLGSPTPGAAGVDNTITASGATPGATVHFVFGTTSGSTAVPACPGLSVDLDTPKIAGTAVADAAGNASLTAPVPSGVAGKTLLLQAVEQSSCRVSNLVNHTF